MPQKQHELHLRIDPILAHLALESRLNLGALLENQIMHRLGIKRQRIVDIRKENKFTGRPTHSHKHPIRKTIYSGIDGKEYCLDE